MQGTFLFVIQLNRVFNITMSGKIFHCEERTTKSEDIDSLSRLVGICFQNKFNLTKSGNNAKFLRQYPSKLREINRSTSLLNQGHSQAVEVRKTTNSNLKL